MGWVALLIAVAGVLVSGAAATAHERIVKLARATTILGLFNTAIFVDDQVSFLVLYLMGEA